MANSDCKIFFGGPIITINNNQPQAEAVGIKGDKIVIVGTLEEVRLKMGENCEFIDLNGKTLLPGFTDSHMHPMGYINHLLNPDLTNVKSLNDLIAYLKEVSEKRKEDEFIIAYNFSEEKFDNATLPNRWDLDKACPNHPVFILRYDGHIGIANTEALKLAELDEHTIVPEGGEIRKDKDGKLTGVISENALNLIFSKISMPDDDLIKAAATKASNTLAQKGLTSIHGIINADNRFKDDDQNADEFSLYQSIQNYMWQDCYSFIETEYPLKFIEICKRYLQEGRYGSKLKIGGLKLYLDGSFGAKTACMFEPFTDAPEQCGFCVIEEEEIYEKMKIAHTNSFQIVIHAIGDRANRIAVDLYKKLLTEFPKKDHRHRIEHASMLTEDVINDMAKFGIIASCQPPFINSEYNWISKRIGEERCKYTYPMKSIVKAGVVLASGSDCPVEDPSPILGLHALVTRNMFVPEECLNIEEALKSYTINTAYAAFEEDIKGSIEVGKFADLVILDRNPLEIPKDEIKGIQVVETIIRGKTVYSMQN
ncbi:MAG: amidohydrolase [Candidatus Lokiarchaeota archaeon]|nr:amidohydrolase [Candidatus Lokiarchaeota archaeon]